MSALISKYDLFRFVLQSLYRTGLHKTFRERTRGLGVILTLHHVRPLVEREYAPNRLLEITPSFLDRSLKLVRALGYEFVSMDEVPARIAANQPSKPFCAITLDDGYLNVIEHALPLFRKHNAPFTVFVTTGFADATSPLWWVDLERSIAALSHISISVDGFAFEGLAKTVEEKIASFERLYATLRAGNEFLMRKVIAGLAAEAGIDPFERVRRSCMSWDELRGLSQDPLASIGAHTLTHPMLAKHELNFVSHEIADSRNIIENELGIDVKHFAYPVGDAGSAGKREFALAAKDGFQTAVTTRPGVLFAEHAKHLHALPRVSLNGLFQNEADLEVLLSGLPFALLNRGRRLNVA